MKKGETTGTKRSFSDMMTDMHTCLICSNSNLYLNTFISCGHVACSSCIEKMQESVGQETITCPFCRTPVQGNMKMAQVVTSTLEQGNVKLMHSCAFEYTDAFTHCTCNTCLDIVEEMIRSPINDWSGLDFPNTFLFPGYSEKLLESGDFTCVSCKGVLWAGLIVTPDDTFAKMCIGCAAKAYSVTNQDSRTRSTSSRIPRAFLTSTVNPVYDPHILQSFLFFTLKTLETLDPQPRSLFQCETVAPIFDRILQKRFSSFFEGCSRNKKEKRVVQLCPGVSQKIMEQVIARTVHNATEYFNEHLAPLPISFEQEINFNVLDGQWYAGDPYGSDSDSTSNSHHSNPMIGNNSISNSEQSEETLAIQRIQRARQEIEARGTNGGNNGHPVPFTVGDDILRLFDSLSGQTIALEAVLVRPIPPRTQPLVSNSSHVVDESGTLLNPNGTHSNPIANSLDASLRQNVRYEASPPSPIPRPTNQGQDSRDSND